MAFKLFKRKQLVKGKKNWIKFSVSVSEEFAEPVVQMLSRFVKGNVFIENVGDPETKQDDVVWVVGFKQKNSDLLETKSNIEAGLKLFSGVFELSDLYISEINSDMWEKQHFDPIFIEDDIVILPNKKNLKKYSKKCWIIVEPSMAFGTGHHPTTKMCITYIKQNVCDNSLVLDLGCGSGILGIVAIKMGAIKCLSLDIEADSVKASIKNSIDSEVSDKLKVEQQDLLKFINVGYKPNLIIANLNSFLFREGTDNILNVMSIGSLMIASGILSENLEEIENMFIRKKLEVLGVSRSGDWVALLTRKVFNA